MSSQDGDATVTTNIQSGIRNVTVRRTGYEPKTVPVTFIAGQQADVTITMTPVAAVKSSAFKWLVAAAAAVFGAKYVMDKSKEGATPADRENPTASQAVPVAVGIAALGAAYLVSRPAQAMTSLASSNPIGTAPAPHAAPAARTHTATAADPADSNFATDAHPASSSTLVSRLAQSTGIRQLFAFQALLYSSRFTDYLPDGLMGDHTRTLIREINRRVGDTTSNDSFGVGMYARAEQARVAAGKPLDRLIPALPQATITAVNQAIRSMAAGPLLQVHATATAAAA